jgi:hypothetical protein
MSGVRTTALPSKASLIALAGTHWPLAKKPCKNSIFFNSSLSLLIIHILKTVTKVQKILGKPHGLPNISRKLITILLKTLWLVDAVRNGESFRKDTN